MTFARENDEPQDKVEWADLFPGIEAHATKDPRIFQTAFKTVKKNPQGLLDGIKHKKYFACVLGKDCFGVDVYRPLGVKSEKECEEAYFKVKAAVEYYESNKKWPSS